GFFLIHLIRQMEQPCARFNYRGITAIQARCEFGFSYNLFRKLCCFLRCVPQGANCSTITLSRSYHGVCVCSPTNCRVVGATSYVLSESTRFLARTTTFFSHPLGAVFATLWRSFFLGGNTIAISCSYS